MYTLTIYEPTETTVLEELAYSVRMVVTTTNATTHPAEVFVLHAEDPEDEGTRAWYEAIASPSELEEHPVDEPAAPGSGDTLNPYFRLDEITVVERHPSLLQDFIDEVVEELTLLESNLTALAALSETPTTVIPIPTS